MPEQHPGRPGFHRCVSRRAVRRPVLFALVLADWEQATRYQRQLAVAADAELRRRHPGEPWPPLRSAEPEAATEPQHDNPAAAPEDDLQQTAQRIGDLAARHREFADGFVREF